MRDSFLSPIPEIDVALDFLDEAASAYLNGEISLAKELIVKADIPEIRSFYILITGKTLHAIHWQSSLPKGMLSRHDMVETKMPSDKEQEAIFVRDGWRCRFCGQRVVSRKARSILIKEFPEETHWISGGYDSHSSLNSQGASLDHILPRSRAGTNDRRNLVTACGPCQFGRNNWTLEEVGFNDPRDRPPVVDSWDGLVRID